MENQNANQFEKYPGVGSEVSSENMEKAKNWEMAMSGETGGEVPEFKGDKYGIAKKENNYYGETVEDEEGNKFDSDLAEASNILNFGLDSVARTYGVEATISKIKGFDASGREDPIGDLFLEFGVDTKYEKDDLEDESEANVSKVAEARRGVSASSRSTSAEAARKAIQEMKELILEVEGADPKYETIRSGAKSAGMGYFEYAIKDYNTRGLAELFQVLVAQKEKDNKSIETEEAEETGEVAPEVGENEEAEKMEKEEEAYVAGEKIEAEGVKKEVFETTEDEKTGAKLNPKILK